MLPAADQIVWLYSTDQIQGTTRASPVQGSCQSSAQEVQEAGDGRLVKVSTGCIVISSLSPLPNVHKTAPNIVDL